jgi:2'-5' RNA ligase
VTDTIGRPWRLFIALPMAAPAAARLTAVLRPYAMGFPTARWQRPDAFHVTLWFLGSTPPERVDGLVEAMRSCARGRAAIAMSTGRGGGTLRNPTGVCWLQIDRGREQASDLARCLGGGSQHGNAARSGPPPHLTVARSAGGPLIDALARATLGEPAVEWQADRMVLYRSHTGTPAGSSYEELASVPLVPARAA